MTDNPVTILGKDGTEYDVIVERATPTLVDRIETLYAQELNPRSRALFDWGYLGPNGSAYVAQAYEHGVARDLPAATYALLAIDFLIDGHRAPGAQAFDAITASAHRGRGLLPQLVATTFAWCAANGVHGNYGFPNANSYPTLRKNLAWQQMDPVPFWVRPVGTRYLRSRLGLRHATATPSGQVIDETAIPADIDDLFARMAGPCFTGIERSRAFLRWRLARPDAGYRTYSETEAGRTVAFGATALHPKHGGNVGYIMELMVDPDHRAAGRHLLRRMARDLSRNGADIILAWSAPRDTARTTTARFGAAGFVPFPERLRPVELHFGSVSFVGDTAFGTRSAWYLSYLDSDVV